MAQWKIVTVIGARPQFIKASAVSRAFRTDGRVHEVIVHTGQHFDPGMSDTFFTELGIPDPGHHLEINSGGHGEMTGRMLERIEAVLMAEKPDMVLVYGDTNSTLAGALAAAKLCIPVAHVEAGLRSFRRTQPEEINRVLTDRVSDLLLCPTRTAVAHLEREGAGRGVHHTGDVMFDVTLHARTRALETSDILDRAKVEHGAYHVATLHRAENTDDAKTLHAAVQFLRDHAREAPVVLPLHPRTRKAAERFRIELDGLHVCDPVGFMDMTRLVAGAVTVLTDSGGLQKEAYFHRVPCVTMRDETEWVELVESGWSRLWKGDGFQERRDIDDFGEGQAAKQVVSRIAEHLEQASRG